jgi:hypothetical protein
MQSVKSLITDIRVVMKLFLKTFILIIVIAFSSCEEKINNPPIENPVFLYKVEGFITHEGLPIQSLKITLDTLSCLTDSTGYFLFDSLKSGQSRIIIVHPQFIIVDTLFNIDRDLTFSFDLWNKSESFLPLKTGNKWYYNPKPDSSGYELVIEVEGTEEIEGFSYYKLLFSQNSSGLIGPIQYYWYMRISNDTLYSYRCEEAGLLSPFNIDLDSIFSVHFCYNDYYARLYEKSNNELKFVYTAILVMDADFGLSFRKGIGITRYSVNGWYDFVLDHYEINY